MTPSLAKLSHRLRDMPLARSLVIRARTFGRPPGGADDGVLFLMYHHAAAGERAALAAQLRSLRNLAQPVGVGDALRLLADAADGGRVGGRFVCLTFDDGYRDAYDNAAPVLQEQQVPAAFFVVPGWIDQARADTFGWAECRALAEAGFEIGSHSSRHRRLAELDGGDALAEIAGSRARIEAELGRPCLHFACPWGQPGTDYLPGREPALAREAGYRSFFTTIQQRALAGADPWCLPRVRMEPGWGLREVRYAFQR